MYIMQMKDKAFKLCSMKFVSSCFGPIKEGNTCRNDMNLQNVWGSKRSCSNIYMQHYMVSFI